MLPSFEQFLRSNYYTSVSSSEAIIQFLPLWIEKLIDDLNQLSTHHVISHKTAMTFVETLRQWGERPKKNLPKDLNLAFLQDLYAKMINTLIFHIELNPRLLSIPGGYPFVPKVSGVKITVRLVDVTTDNNVVFSQESFTRSVIGGAQQRVALKKIKKQFGQIAWLKKRLAELGKTILEILPSAPHAEHDWFVQHAQILLDHCLKTDALKKLPKLNDMLPQTQLAQTIRLEIITSSSCCREYCRYMFSALRLELQANGIHLPMVLYADTSYNNARQYSETHGSIYVINSKGHVINTALQCVTPKTKKQEDLPLTKLQLSKLSTREQQDFACLARIGGLVLLDLIKVASRTRYIDQGEPNPFTYITPDTLIIYLAEDLDIQRKMKPELVQSVTNLNQTLTRIDKKLLVYWRMCFTDQLHWLLISHRDSRYYEMARKNAGATNINFADEVHQDEESELGRFYDEFATVWQSARNLAPLYQKMFDFFMEKSQIRMPLGSVVGPLSTLMIQEDPDFSDSTKAYLLKARKMIEVEDDLSEESEEEEGEAEEQTPATIIHNHLPTHPLPRVSALLSTFSFFIKLNETLMTENRHDSPQQQQAYDKRFGLVLRG